jgi:hypothetical protein
MLLVAPPKTGKSRLVMQLGLCVATGKHFLGQPVRPGTVAYLSLEDPPQLTQDRVRATQARLQTTLQRGKFFMHATWAQGEAAVNLARERLAEMTDPRLFIVDVLQRIRDNKDSHKPLYEVDYDQLKPWAELRRDFPGLSIVIVHHTRKYKSREVEDPFSEISGTQGLAGAVDSLWMLLRPGLAQTDKANPQSSKDKLLFYVRSRYNKYGDFEAVLESSQDLIELTDMKPWELADADKQVDIRKLMETDPAKLWTSSDVHTKLDDGTTINATRNALKRMAKRGWIIGQNGAGYTLVDMTSSKM